MAINNECYEYLNKIVSNTNQTNLSFNLSNGLLGLGSSCRAEKHEEIKITVAKFLNDQQYDDENKLKYIAALNFGFMLAS